MKKLYIILAAIADIVLLAVIVKSYCAEKNGQAPAAQDSAGAVSLAEFREQGCGQYDFGTVFLLDSSCCVTVPVSC